MISVMTSMFGGKTDNKCKEMQLVHGKLGYLWILYTYATSKSVLWICVKRVGICKSSRFQSVTVSVCHVGNTLISKRI